MNVRNEIKAQIIRAGMTMQEVVDLLDVYKRQRCPQQPIHSRLCHAGSQSPWGPLLRAHGPHPG